MAGQLPALRGSAFLHGQTIDERHVSFRKSVATVFDEDAFFPALTVREHLTLVATGHEVPDVAAAVEPELEFFGLIDAADAFPTNLSSGQRRRLLLAAAFVRPAELLCLDEPEQRLDAGMRRRLADRLTETTQGGTSLVFATHDADFVAECASSALLIADAVQQLDPVAGVQAIRTL